MMAVIVATMAEMIVVNLRALQSAVSIESIQKTMVEVDENAKDDI